MTKKKIRSYSYTVCEHFGLHGRWTIDLQPNDTYTLLLNGYVQEENIADIDDAKTWAMQDDALLPIDTNN